MRLDWIGAGRTWPRARSKFQAPLFQVRATSTATPPRLDIRTIERKRHAQWAINEAKQAPQRGKKGKAYVLPMFPYPSGTLHMGHLRVYTISDVIARFKHMQGYNVIHPMGWDGFGLPAENAAIERGVDPEKWTIENIAKMKEQLVAMGGRWNWDRELMTCDPKFYKHTQRIFLDLYERGLAYQAESMVNYDPIDQTVLANEQVDGKGYSWRSGAKVEQRKLKQWFLRITHYKEELLKDLDILETDQSWPERVISQQKNWLGKSTGAKIGFDISSPRMKSYPVDVFTTRPDTLYGVQFLALSSSHPLVLEAAKTDSALRTFLDSIPALPPDSKAGYRLPDLHGDNPIYSLDGAPKGNNGKLPVFVAPYVLSEYGGAAVMGVPGHDSRDSAFFKENCSGEEARTVILPTREAAEAGAVQDPYTSPGILNTDCGPFAGLPSSEATPSILTALQAAGFYAEATSTWRLRDWLISRQRYWGTPIPIIHCPKCGPVPVPRASLPVTLPPLPANPTKGNPLASASSWLHVPCPRCSTPAKRETDTMDTFVDSSWYHLRFSDPQNDHEPFSAHAASSTLPVDLYIGGVEHAILHLLYARFMTKFLSSLLPPASPPTPLPQQKGEPFTRLLAQGMVHGPTYRCGRTGRYLRPSELSWSSQGDRLPTVVATGEAAILSWEKMSKSKHNGVDPSSVIAAHGASATRAHMLFAAPVGEVLDWDAGKIVGVQRWLAKVWRLTHISAAPSNAPRTNPALPPLETFSDADARVWLAVQQALGSVTHAFDRSYALNTVVSTLMELTNTILEAEKGVNDGVRVQATRCLVQMMAPVTPALSEECWAVLHGGDEDESVFDAGWPELDGSVRVLGSRGGKCAVQVDGAVKFVVELPRVPDGMGEEALREWLVGRIGETEGGRKWLRERREWGRWKRVVVVKKGKVVNFVY